jgi:hypothetical protein
LNIAAYLKSKGDGEHIMDLIRFHSNGSREEDVVEQRSRVVSFDVLSDPGSSSVSFVGKTLRADNVHHNMFHDSSELNHPTFSRFAFPEQDDILGTSKVGAQEGVRLKEIAKDLKTIRSFLSYLSSCTEHLTQAVFTVFLTSLLKIINQDDEDKGNHSAQEVSGMETIKTDADVSAKYTWRCKYQKRDPGLVLLTQKAQKKKKNGLDNRIGSRFVGRRST